MEIAGFKVRRAGWGKRSRDTIALIKSLGQIEDTFSEEAIDAITRIVSGILDIDSETARKLVDDEVINVGNLDQMIAYFLGGYKQEGPLGQTSQTTQ